MEAHASVTRDVIVALHFRQYGLFIYVVMDEG
jgi:hypothetical protein